MSRDLTRTTELQYFYGNTLNTIDYLLADIWKEIHLKLTKTVRGLTLPATTQSFPFLFYFG